MQDLILNQYGEPIKVSVRTSGIARNISIRIKQKIVELVVPPSANYEKAYIFLASKEIWIRKKINEHIVPQKIPEDIIAILGKSYKVILILENIHAVKLNDDKIEIYSNEKIYKTVLQIFLKNKLFEEITNIAHSITKKFNLYYDDIKIMDNKTRWGSCSTQRILSFNWRLIFGPPELVKYLVVHEMAHLKEMNHSKKFWDLVKKIYPEYEIGKLWLKKNGQRLYSYLGEKNV